MKLKMLITTGIVCTLLQSCTTYKPIIDTKGRSGTYDISRSDEITDDLITCKSLAKDNTNMVMESGKYVWNFYFRPASLWLSPCLLYTSPSPRDVEESRMPSSA